MGAELGPQWPCTRQKIGFWPISPPGRDLKSQTLVLSSSMDSVDTLQFLDERKTPSTARDIKYTLWLFFNYFTWRHVLNMYLPLLKLGESSPDMAMSNHCNWIGECIFDVFSTSFPSGAELKIFQFFFKNFKKGGPCADPFLPSTRTHPKIQICTESLCQKECFKIFWSGTGSALTAPRVKIGKKSVFYPYHPLDVTQKVKLQLYLNLWNQ